MYIYLCWNLYKSARVLGGGGGGVFFPPSFHMLLVPPLSLPSQRGKTEDGWLMFLSFFFTSSPTGLALSSSRHALASVSLWRHTRLHQQLTARTQWDSGMSDAAGRGEREGRWGAGGAAMPCFPQSWCFNECNLSKPRFNSCRKSTGFRPYSACHIV